MEIERKYLIDKNKLPMNYNEYPYHEIEQAYLCTEPVVRVRRSDYKYYMSYKSKGLMVREEYNLPLTKDGYEHLLEKADGIIIKKKRYLIPYDGYTVELDIFEDSYDGLVLAEVEFETEEQANTFQAPEWFGEDVTFDTKYHNSTLSQGLKKCRNED